MEDHSVGSRKRLVIIIRYHYYDTVCNIKDTTYVYVTSVSRWYLVHHHPPPTWIWDGLRTIYIDSKLIFTYDLLWERWTWFQILKMTLFRITLREQSEALRYIWWFPAFLKLFLSKLQILQFIAYCPKYNWRFWKQKWLDCWFHC